MKPIPTKYKGCLFRSRLEARWAVFFDALQLKWQYEPEGFDLKNGAWYLPDFRLPEQQVWLEIKGDRPTEEDLWKVYYFQTELWERGEDFVFIFCGDIPYPYPKTGNAIASISDYFPLHAVPEYCWKQCPICSRVGIGYLGSAFCETCVSKAYDKLEKWINGTLDESDFEILPKLINWEYFVKLGGNVDDLRVAPAFEKDFVLTPRLVDKELFSSGHKAHKLREAYAAARSARFEHGASGGSA